MDSAEPPSSRQRVLIVDAEASVRHTLSVLLAQAGHAVAEAEDGGQALAQLQKAAFELVLVDVRASADAGLDVLHRIQTLSPPPALIVMSAATDLDAAMEVLERGAQEYIAKPLREPEVLCKIKMATRRRQDDRERLRLLDENARLKGERSAPELSARLVGKSRALDNIFKTLAKIADYKSTVLLTGESGTGKELVARALHEQSSRAPGPFVPINCGAIPEELLESELFGYVRGAFTDAQRDKKGLVEEADGGTLFLDEIAELPASLQVKLLRFLQDDVFRRLGDTRDRSVDVRIVAATARELGPMVDKGTFREDLYYRLNVLEMRIPPLRERRDDIPVLAEHFIQKYGQRLGRSNITLSKEALRAFMDYHWPGNVRELENVIERALVLSDGPSIDRADLPDALSAEPSPALLSAIGEELSIKKAVRAIERELIRRSLDRTDGNRTRAAELLEISHRALLYKIKEYGLG